VALEAWALADCRKAAMGGGAGEVAGEVAREAVREVAREAGPLSSVA
jgi:hypothetical protein